MVLNQPGDQGPARPPLQPEKQEHSVLNLPCVHISAWWHFILCPQGQLWGSHQGSLCSRDPCLQLMEEHLFPRDYGQSREGDATGPSALQAAGVAPFL